LGRATVRLGRSRLRPVEGDRALRRRRGREDEPAHRLHAQERRPPQLRSELVQNQQLDPDHWQRTGPEGCGQPPGPGLDIVRIAEGGQSQDALLQVDQDQCGTLVGGDR
jgi:hypothetical protein